MITGTLCFAAVIAMSGSASMDTSLTMCAPAEIATCATVAFRVSMLIGISRR